MDNFQPLTMGVSDQSMDLVSNSQERAGTFDTKDVASVNSCFLGHNQPLYNRMFLFTHEQCGKTMTIFGN